MHEGRNKEHLGFGSILILFFIAPNFGQLASRSADPWAKRKNNDEEFGGALTCARLFQVEEKEFV